MGHNIYGFIGRLGVLAEAAAGLNGAQVVPLASDFGFMPLTHNLAGDEEPAPFSEFERLTTRLSQWAEYQSRQFPLAYIATDYFGGRGSQAAIVWEGGRSVFGTVTTSNLEVQTALH